MPPNRGAKAKARRQEGAQARAAAVETAQRAAMTPEELRLHNAALAAEKAAREEGLGHFRPELREVELVKAVHVSKWKYTTAGQRILDPKADPCRVYGCIQCTNDSDDVTSRAIGRARNELREKRGSLAKRLGVDTTRKGSLSKAGY